jgi:hypothetical protein
MADLSHRDEAVSKFVLSRGLKRGLGPEGGKVSQHVAEGILIMKSIKSITPR